MELKTSRGDKFGSVSASSSTDELEKALKFFDKCHQLFQFKDVRVVKRGTSFVLEAPSTKGLIKIVLLHKFGEDDPSVFFSPLETSSVTQEGNLRLTEAYISEPAHGSPREAILQTALKNPAFAYLDGVYFEEMVQFVNGEWLPLLRYNKHSRPDMLGLVVDPGVVRVVKLKFGDSFVPIVLRQDPEEPLSSAVRKSCDWHAWPAVSFLADNRDPEIDAGGAIVVPGE
jgi:hypothetical protein